MQKYLFAIIVFLLVNSSLSYADELIIEPDQGRAPILAAMDETQHSLNLTMYGMTDPELINKIVTLKKRGKSVNVFLEQHPYRAETENELAIAQLQAQHIAWQGDIAPYRLIHQKTLLIDNHKAIVMTFNFTRATFKNERNFAIVLDNPADVNAIEDIFSADWNHKKINLNQATHLIVSPDNSRYQLTEIMNQSKRDLRLYAQTINDYKIVGSLAKIAKKGVNVKIITSSHLRAKQESYLQKAGVNIRYSKKLKIHAKVIIVDQRFAVIGSINMTRSSLDNNRELAVITQDSHIIKRLTQTFEKDWREKQLQLLTRLEKYLRKKYF